VQSSSTRVKDLPRPKFHQKIRFTKPDSNCGGDGGSDLEGGSSSDEFEEGSSQGSIPRHKLEGGSGEDDDAGASRVVQWTGDDEIYGGSEDEKAGSEIPVEVRLEQGLK
jgi:hypothetical protein